VRIVSVINHKGGVGKTTFTGCVSQALALSGFRVLAIDNDSQHNLSTMLGSGVQHPTMRDVYLSDSGEASRIFLEGIRTTFLDELHIVTSEQLLSVADVKGRFFLRDCLRSCDLGRFYDYVMIDNAPGFDMLQLGAMYASDELFVPTELRQFAVDGLVELEHMLMERFPDAPRITRIIPNFYRNSKRQNSFLSALNQLFPGRVTATAIPLDSVFDEIITDSKILFLHRLYSRGAAYYLKVIHELFNFNEDELWEQMMDKRKKRISDDARKRFYAKRGEHETVTAP
jgi:chromosome partitioning protein